MTTIAGKPFSQLQNLNLLDELRIQGVLVTPSGASFQITEVNSTYTVVILDDGVSATGTFNVTLFASSLAGQYVTVKSVAGGGTITVLPDGSETIEGASSHALTAGQSVTLMPVSAGWLIV